MIQTLGTYIKDNRNKLMDYTLLIVCNTKSDSKNRSNYEDFDVSTEYLTDTEFEQVISMFDKCHLKNIEVFKDEYSFIDYVLKNKNIISNQKNIVYCSAQSGTGVGRKSLIPAFCMLEGLPCTGSNPYVVSLCRQKYHVNKLLEISKLPVPSTYLYDNGWLFNQKPLQQQEIILKPIYESASIGIDSESKKKYVTNIDKEIQVRNKKMRQPIIAQQFIDGYEVEFPVYVSDDNIFPLLPVGLALSPDELKMGENFLNYESIYFDKYIFFDFEKNDNYNTKIIDTVKRTVTLLGMHGLCRVDFRITDKENYYITDVSTNPHFISHSSVNYAFNQVGLNERCIAESILLSAL